MTISTKVGVNSSYIFAIKKSKCTKEMYVIFLKLIVQRWMRFFSKPDHPGE